MTKLNLIETEIEKELRYEWRGFAVVDDSFEDSGVSLNADRIADWWLQKYNDMLQALLDTAPKAYRDMANIDWKMGRDFRDKEWRTHIQSLITKL
jgi:hypothetical protein